MVVGLLAVFMGRGAAIAGGDGPFVIVALVFLGSAIGLGATGARSIEETGRARSGGPAAVNEPGTLEYVQSRAIRRALPFEMAMVAATVVAMLILVSRSPRT